MYSSKKLTIIFLNILKIKNSNIKNTEFQKTKNWDSLKNIQLFLEIEKTFKIKINTSDWYKLTSFKKIDNYLKKKI